MALEKRLKNMREIQNKPLTWEKPPPNSVDDVIAVKNPIDLFKARYELS